MARRKANKGYLSDGDSSGHSSEGDEGFDGEGGDSRAERDLFDDPYANKKRKRGGKEDELYGVFAEDDEDEGFSGGGRGGGGKGNGGGAGGGKGKRMDWTKAPTFAPSGSSSSSSAPPPPLSNLSGNVVEGIPDFVPMPSSRRQHTDAAAEAMDEDDDGDSSNDSSSDDEDESRAPSPRVRDDDDDSDEDGAPPPPARGFGARAGIGGGIGSRAPETSSMPPPRTGGIGFSSTPHSGGIGFASHTTTLPSTIPTILPSTSSYSASSSYANAPPPPSSNLPSSFGAAPPPPRARTSFLPQQPTASSSSAPPVALSKEDAQAFRKMEGSFGARMLAKQGWASGTGLGAKQEGIVTPVESKLRPRAMGIGHNGFRERTDQSKREAIRRGDEVDSDEERKKKSKAKSASSTSGRKGASGAGVRGGQDLDDDGSGARGKDHQPWRKPKKVKIRVEHKTYEQIIAEAGENAHAGAGVGMIIDATGATPREVSSLAGLNLSSWTPTSDTTRLPELRHNLRMICDMTKGDLDALAKEGAAVAEKRKWLAREDENLKRRVVEEAKKISRLQQIHLIIDEVSGIAKTLSSSYEPSLDAFLEPFDRLLFEFADEYKEHSLDEVVVGAIAPAVRRLVAAWNPLSSSTELFASLRRWKKAFRFTDPDKAEDEAVQVFGGGGDLGGKRTIVEDLVMSPYESLMWNVWLPKVRSAINNDWSPDEPSAAVHLFETWIPLLPRFLHDNILDQLILPKVNKAVSDWKPRNGGASLQGIVFPWLPFLGDRMEEVLGDAKRRVRGMLKGWKVEDKVPEELRKWKDVFTAAEWDSLILKYILPKLGSTLRDDFKINPRNQILDPLHHVLAWQDVLRPSMLSQLLETEFFPKWLDVLYIWLTQPKPNFDEVTQWYSYWKSVFPESVLTLQGVSVGFKRGLDLMNQAMALGSSAPSRLQRPDSNPVTVPSRPSTPLSSSSRTKKSSSNRPHPEEITFRSLAEDFVAKHDLIWVPTGRSEVNTGQMLFRISRDGKSGGVVCYVADDAVYVAEHGEATYHAITLEELVKRATK